MFRTPNPQQTGKTIRSRERWSATPRRHPTSGGWPMRSHRQTTSKPLLPAWHFASRPFLSARRRTGGAEKSTAARAASLRDSLSRRWCRTGNESLPLGRPASVQSHASRNRAEPKPEASQSQPLPSSLPTGKSATQNTQPESHKLARHCRPLSKVAQTRGVSWQREDSRIHLLDIGLTGRIRSSILPCSHKRNLSPCEIIFQIES